MAWREDLDLGKVRVEQPLKLPVYTLATVPVAADHPDSLIIISDATPPCVAFSNGSVWLATDDGTEAA